MTTRPQPTHGVSMQDLRLIGVDDDGGHLLLASVDGARFRVPLDESLRAAARRDRPRLGQLQIEIEGGMRPRDVQAMVRAGMSADEVAERSGWTVEKVHKYEGPILAEREYVAGLGRAVRLRQRGGSGPSTTLGQRVADRLTARGVEADSIEWDAWRREGPEWTVAVNFSAGGRVR
ncbi:MAG TPA: septation protein SepH, partial [Dermatophilaceae bacterium]|nr:septation protein SepH [Dermatophilaceae bacterium]HPK89341.1 septation protein SepH [Dermatophilaceae bacterium]